MLSRLRRVKYNSKSGGLLVGYFHKYILRKGEYTGYSKGALIENEFGRLITLNLGEFRFIDPPRKNYRKVVFTNSKNATELGLFHLWVRRKGLYKGIDTFALIERDDYTLSIQPYNSITFVNN